MTTEQIRPQICVFIAAQATLMTVLQEIPTGRQDKPYCMLSLALALTGLTEPLAAMIYGAVCGALCDLLGSGRIGFYAAATSLVCAVVSYWLQNVWQNRFITRSLLWAAAVFTIIGANFFLFRAWQEGSGQLALHYLWRILLTYPGIFPLYGVNQLFWRRHHGARA